MVFDLGGVLVDVVPEWSREAWSEMGLPETLFESAFMDSGAKPGGDVGDHDERAMARLVSETIERPFSVTSLREVWGAMVRWRPWVPTLLPRLLVPYGVLSTIDPVHAHVLGALPGAVFHAFSCEDGYAKPHPDAFRLALNRCPVPPAEVLYLDDRAENVQAALEAGMNAHQVTNQAEAERCLEHVLSPE